MAGTLGIHVSLTSPTSREVEPNDAVGTGASLDSAVFSGAIGSAGDKDHFTVHGEAGQLVSISLAAAPGGGGTVLADLGSALLPNLEVRDGQGHLLSATSADRKGESNFAQSYLRPESMVEASFRAPAAGDYDVTISDVDGQGGQASRTPCGLEEPMRALSSVRLGALAGLLFLASAAPRSEAAAAAARGRSRSLRSSTPTRASRCARSVSLRFRASETGHPPRWRTSRSRCDVTRATA